MNSRRSRQLTRAAALAVLTLAACTLPACYTRVTKATGIGSDYSHPDRYESSEPASDRWFDNWGSKEKKPGGN